MDSLYLENNKKQLSRKLMLLPATQVKRIHLHNCFKSRSWNGAL